MSEPEKCRICHVELEEGEAGLCTDCAHDRAMEIRDMGVAW